MNKQQMTKNKLLTALLWVFLFPIMATMFIAKLTSFDKTKKIVAIILVWVISLTVFSATTCGETNNGEIKSIKNFATTYYSCKVDESISFATEMLPGGITKEKIKVILSNNSAFNVSLSFVDYTDKTTVNCYLTAKIAGTYTFQISNIEETIKSNVITIKISDDTSNVSPSIPSTPSNPQEPSTPSEPVVPSNPSNTEDTSRVVYITPYGTKYHYSKSCAGKNATETTQNKAEKAGRTGCKTCT